MLSNLSRKIIVGLGIAFITLVFLSGLSGAIPWSYALGAISFVSVLTAIIRFYPSNDQPELDKKIHRLIDASNKKQHELIDEVTNVGRGVYYDIEVAANEILLGDISTDGGTINYYITDEINLRKWEKGRSFDYQKGSERIYRAKIEFIPEDPNLYYLIIEKGGKEPVKANIKIYKTAKNA